MLSDIKRCRICIDDPVSVPLPHEPRPVFQVSAKAKLVICGQAPGTRVHLSGRPFTDRSGDRLREWMGIGEHVFYDASRVAVIPMGFCFPGQTKTGADLPPRAECAAYWHDQLFRLLPQLSLILVVGRYAMDYHLNIDRKTSLQQVVARYRDYLGQTKLPRKLPLPHPSWRNTGWLKKNPWFEKDYLPLLRSEVRKTLDTSD